MAWGVGALGLRVACSEGERDTRWTGFGGGVGLAGALVSSLSRSLAFSTTFSVVLSLCQSVVLAAQPCHVELLYECATWNVSRAAQIW